MKNLSYNPKLRYTVFYNNESNSKNDQEHKYNHYEAAIAMFYLLIESFRNENGNYKIGLTQENSVLYIFVKSLE